MILSVDADAVVHARSTLYTLPADRIAHPGVTLRVSVLDVRFNDIVLTHLTGGESVRYEIRDLDEQVLSSGDATYETILTTRTGSYAGWTAVATMPELPGYYRVVWTLRVAGAIEQFVDKLQVVSTDG
jgi:hypothetical protein